MTVDGIDRRAVHMPEDSEFLLAVYASTRQRDLALMGLSSPEPPDVQASAFIAMQFEAQSRHYGMAYPRAEHSIVVVGIEPAGRLLVDRSDDGFLIVDVALLPPFQGRGIGRALVERIGERADAEALGVVCHVVVGSGAEGFWRHLGFQESTSSGAHILMERACATSQR